MLKFYYNIAFLGTMAFMQIYSLNSSTSTSIANSSNISVLLTRSNFLLSTLPVFEHELTLEKFDTVLVSENMETSEFASLRSLQFKKTIIQTISQVQIFEEIISNANSTLQKCPSIIFFPFIANMGSYIQILNKIAEFYHLDFKARSWRPIFLLAHPQSPFLNKSASIAMEYVRKPVNPEILQIMINLSIDSDVYILYNVQPIKNADKYWIIQEYYSIRDQLITHELDSGNYEKKINFDKLIYGKTVRRSNFEQATVIAIGADDPDYPLATKFKPGTLELESGFEVLVFKYLKDALNFSEAAVKSTGYIREGANGHLTGLAIQVVTEGDISIGSAEFLGWRMKGPDGITFIQPMFYANVYAYFKQPPSSSVRNIFTQTFTTGCWLAACGIWILIVIILKWVAYLKKKKNKAISAEDESIALESVIWAASTICQQGWYKSPSSGSIRIIFFFGIFTGLILYIAYSAALVSILSIEVVPIQKFLDLINEKFFIVSDSHIPTAKFVVQGLEQSGQIPTLNEGVRNVEVETNLVQLVTKKYAMVTISDSFYPILQQHNFTEKFICKTISVQVVSSRPLKSSCVVRRGSPLREAFNQKMVQMHERGIREKLVKDYVLGTTVQCLQSSSIFHDDLGLRDVFTAYIILVVGMTVGTILLFVEKFVARRNLKYL